MTIVLGIEKIALPVQVKTNQNERRTRALPDSLDWRTKSVVTPVQDYTGSPYTAGVVMVGK
jgi:hypothetical protein